MFYPPYPGGPSWPCDLRRELRNCLLGCAVSGDVNGDASESYSREPSSHLGTAVAPGGFTLGEEVGPRNLRFTHYSAGGLTIEGDTAIVGCSIIDESVTAIAGPFTVQFALNIGGGNFALLESNGLSRSDIFAGVTVSGPDFSTLSTVDFELSFS